MIYVDQLFDTSPFQRASGFRSNLACHLWADWPGELVSFARELGLKMSWVHNNRARDFPHFDLTPGMRAKALSLGAVERDLKEYRRTIRGKRTP